MKKFLKSLGQILAVIALALGVIYFLTVQKDDEGMIGLKQSIAAFIRSDKQVASVSDVLGVKGSKICMSYPSFLTQESKKTVKAQLSLMFPARAEAIEEIASKNQRPELVMGIENGKDLAVMTGRRDISVDGKSWALTVPHKKNLTVNEGFACFSYTAAKFIKRIDKQSTGTENTLLLTDPLSDNIKKPVAEKSKQKKKSAPPTVKKATKPARSYGY